MVTAGTVLSGNMKASCKHAIVASPYSLSLISAQHRIRASVLTMSWFEKRMGRKAKSLEKRIAEPATRDRKLKQLSFSDWQRRRQQQGLPPRRKPTAPDQQQQKWLARRA
jgi:hypothetical protein